MISRLLLTIMLVVAANFVNHSAQGSVIHRLPRRFELKQEHPELIFRTLGAYTRPPFQLNVSTFGETRWLVSLCQ